MMGPPSYFVAFAVLCAFLAALAAGDWGGRELRSVGYGDSNDFWKNERPKPDPDRFFEGDRDRGERERRPVNKGDGPDRGEGRGPGGRAGGMVQEARANRHNDDGPARARAGGEDSGREDKKFEGRQGEDRGDRGGDRGGRERPPR